MSLSSRYDLRTIGICKAHHAHNWVVAIDIPNVTNDGQSWRARYLLIIHCGGSTRLSQMSVSVRAWEIAA